MNNKTKLIMRSFLLILLISVFTLGYSNPVFAAKETTQKITKLESRVAKKFSKTFCNSTGFGISSDGALKFSIGETKVEFSKNPLISKVNIENIKDNILEDIANSCYYFDLNKDDLAELIVNPED